MDKFQLAQITGATSGIGEALAILLAEKGIPLFLSGRDEKKLIELKIHLEKKVPVTIFPADLTLEGDRERLFVAMMELTPDLIVNNAGIGLYGQATELSYKAQSELLDLNCKALMEISIHGARILIAEMRPGVIFNVSSTTGFVVFPTMAAYAASKAFVNSFSLSLDLELRSSNIRVLAVCPGKVRTAFFARAVKRKVEYNDTFGVMSPQFVASEVWKQIIKGRSIRIIDWKYRLGIAFSKIVPRGLIALVLSSVIKARKHDSQ